MTKRRMTYRKLWLHITTLAAASVFSIPVSAATLDVPKEYETIQDAIKAAARYDTITVEPGTYTTEDLTLNGKSDITLQGQETARTILRSAIASKPILTISDSSKIKVKNFTWQDAQTGISVSGSANITIAANIFTLGVAGTGVTATNSDAEIVNNTFYENKVGISRSTSATEIINNFFAKNLTAILNASADATNISYNGFYRNTADDPLGTSAVTQLDPLFVDIDSNDFHVRAGSPVIDKGVSTDSAHYGDTTANLSDLGAYGGQYADTFPYPVSAAELTATVAENTYSATLKWNANSDYRVTGYNAYHYVEPGASTYPNSSVPVDDTTTNSASLSGPVPTTTAPAIPELISVTPRNQMLTVLWGSVTGATGYELHYGVGSSDEHSIPTGNVSSYALAGLENGVTYKIRVLAVAQAVLHAAVKAHDAHNHQSNAFFKEMAINIGPRFTSELSNEATGIPEATVPYPVLPNEGCFIATAAYGHYSAPQVQALRDFRDRYLLTHRAGRAFITWYYDYGPTGAHYLNEHPALKPSVRVLLYPFVIGALFLTQAPLWSHLLVLLCVILLAGHLVQRRWMNTSSFHG